MLDRVDAGIWIAEGGLVSFYGFPYPTRSVLVRFDNGDLWLWSPIQLTAALRAEIDALGRIAHLVSPNKLHHLWLGEWARAYPGAQLWGPQSLVRKRRHLAFGKPLTDTPPPGWVPWIDQAWFRGSPLLDEVVFCHRPSRTAIVGDLIQTFTDGFLHEHWSWWQRVLARADGITEAKAHAPLEWRLSCIDRRAARAARDKVLGWGCERVIVAHGAWQPSNGSAFLGRALSWLRA